MQNRSTTGADFQSLNNENPLDIGPAYEDGVTTTNRRGGPSTATKLNGAGGRGRFYSYRLQRDGVLLPLSNDANIQKPLNPQESCSKAATNPKLPRRPQASDIQLRTILKARRKETMHDAIARHKKRLKMANQAGYWRNLASSDTFLSDREREAFVARRANAVVCALDALGDSYFEEDSANPSWSVCCEEAARTCWGGCVGGEISRELIHLWFLEFRDMGKFQLPTASYFWKMPQTRRLFGASDGEDILALIEQYKARIKRALATDSCGDLVVGMRTSLTDEAASRVVIKTAVVWTMLRMATVLLPQKNWMYLCSEAAVRLKIDGWVERAHWMTANLYFREFVSNGGKFRDTRLDKI